MTEEMTPATDVEATESVVDIANFIQAKIDAHPVMLFMKGTPQFPQCGFSAAVVQILDFVGAEFGTENVLMSDDLRDGIKTFSDWPTIPQLYVKGEFVGGCDIIKEMFEQGELRPYLEEKGIALTS